MMNVCYETYSFSCTCRMHDQTSSEGCTGQHPTSTRRDELDTTTCSMILRTGLPQIACTHKAQCRLTLSLLFLSKTIRAAYQSVFAIQFSSITRGIIGRTWDASAAEHIDATCGIKKPKKIKNWAAEADFTTLWDFGVCELWGGFVLLV